MAKIEEKNPVGRPKLAESELIKDSWCRIGAGLSIALVLVVCGIGVLTAKTPLEVLTMKNTNKAQASVKYATYDPSVRYIAPKSAVTITRVLPANKVSKRIIDANGNVTKIIPATSSILK